MPSNRSRRRYLAEAVAIGLAGLGGCTEVLGTSRGVTDVTVHNDTDERRSIDVTVRKPDAEPADIDRTVELAPNATETINNELVMGSDYEVAVTVTGADMDSPYSETQTWSDAGDPLHVIVNEQIVFAVEIG